MGLGHPLLLLKADFVYGVHAARVGRISVNHLYAARLRLDKKLNSKSCSSLPPIDAPPQRWSAELHRATPTSKSRKLQR